MDHSFGESREGQFLATLVDTVDKSDHVAFTEALQEFDRMTKLDPWKTTLLLRVKEALGEEPSLT